MFSHKTTRYLAIALPLLLALLNLVPSNLFLSMATMLAVFGFYISTQGAGPYHEWLQRTAIAAAACAAIAVPVVIFDAFFLVDNPEVSETARILKALWTVNPYFSFFISIGYGLFAAVKVATLVPPTKSNKK
jgi:hypothetical protein